MSRKEYHRYLRAVPLFADVDDILAGLDHLRFNGHNVVVLHTVDPYELEFPFKGTWKFKGLENEEESHGRTRQE